MELDTIPNDSKNIKRTPIYSIFDISGKTENALTLSFGAILRKDKVLLKKLIYVSTKKKLKISKKLFESSEFYFERNHEEGRTDIEIANEQFHIIIESKIQTNEVKPQQATRYAEILKRSNSKNKIFIFITEVGNIDISPKLKSKYPSIFFYNLSWEETLPLHASSRFRPQS